MDEALAEQQRAAYKMPGVDDEEPALDPSKKRKAVEAENVSLSVIQTSISQPEPCWTTFQENAKKAKNEKPRERVNTAVYITSLPEDVDEEELFKSFSRFGVIAEGIDDNKPRIKMYYNEEGEFNGDALIGEIRHHQSSMSPLTRNHSLLPTRIGQAGHQYAWWLRFSIGRSWYQRQDACEGGRPELQGPKRQACRLWASEEERHCRQPRPPKSHQESRRDEPVRQQNSLTWPYNHTNTHRPAA
jgi:hypothetical protein